MRFRRRVTCTTAIAAVLATVAYGLVAPGTTQAARADTPAVVATGPVTYNGMPGQCLDVYHYSDALAHPGYINPVGVRGCDGSAEQQFTLMSDDTLQINGMCLNTDNVQLGYDYGPFASGSRVNRVSVWSCGTATDHWTPNGSGGLVSAVTGDCLDDADGSTGTNSQLLVADNCSGAATQQWTRPVYNGAAPVATEGVQASGPIISGGVSGACLDDYQVATYNGAPVDVYPCNYGQSQTWTLMTDGTLQINGACLTAGGQKADPADPASYYTTLALFACDPATYGPAQTWVFNSSGQLVNGAGGCADDTDSSTGLSAGLGLVLNTCSTATTQTWYMPGASDDPQVALTGGDISFGVDDGGLDPNVVRQVIDNVMPVNLGLPVGTPVGDTFLTSFNGAQSDLQNAGQLPPGLPQPPSLPDDSVAVDGSTITVTIPADDANPNHLAGRALSEWTINLIALAASILAYTVTAGFCVGGLAIAAGLTGPEAAAASLEALVGGVPTSWFSWPAFVCGELSTIVSYAVYYGMYYWLEPGAYHPPVLQTIITSVLGGGALQGLNLALASPYIYSSNFKTLMVGKIGPAISKYLTNGWVTSNAGKAAISYVASLVIGLGTAIPAAWKAITANLPGSVAPVNGPGEIISGIPASADHPQGLCLDNTGGVSVGGNPVGIFDCNGKPGEQDWTVWSNGWITIDGWCLAALGNTAGTKLIIGICARDPSENWSYGNSQFSQANPNALVNQNLCLEDAGASIVNTSQQQINTCDTNAEQQWTLPGLQPTAPEVPPPPPPN